MEKVRPWCGQPSDRGRLGNRTFTYLHYFILLSNLLIIFAILFVGNEEGSMFDMTICGYNQKHHFIQTHFIHRLAHIISRS